MRPFTSREARARRVLLWALLLSVAIHFVGGSIWAELAHRVHRPSPRDIAEQTDRVTIENLPSPSPTPVPTPSPTPRPTPTPTPPPRVAPYSRPDPVPHVVVRVTAPHLSHRSAATRPREESMPRPTLAPKQIAALTPQFAQTIAEENRLLHVSGTQGASDDAGGMIFAEGSCRDYAIPQIASGIIAHYLECYVVFSDGYREWAAFPWPFHFPVADDPVTKGRIFHGQPPPPGFVLKPNVELSRAVCAYFPQECAQRLAHQQATNAGTAAATPP